MSRGASDVEGHAAVGAVPSVEAVIILTDRAHMPRTSLTNVLCYEELLAAEDDDFAWPQFDENTASSMCYTSGTTGPSKAVRCSYRHHEVYADWYGRELNETDRCFLCLPMFHIGGTGWLYGGILGAVVFKVMQDVLSSITPQYWTFCAMCFAAASSIAVCPS